MKHYNIYYKSEKINKRPVSESVIDVLKKKQYVYRKNEDTQTMESYPVSQLKIVNCIIV